MARQRVVLQTPRTVTTAESQLNEDAIPVGNNRSAVVFCDMYNTTNVTVTINIDTCAAVDRSAGGASWTPVGTFIYLNTTGSRKAAITSLGDAIRWRVQSAPSGTPTFSLKVFFCDS